MASRGRFQTCPTPFQTCPHTYRASSGTVGAGLVPVLGWACSDVPPKGKHKSCSYGFHITLNRRHLYGMNARHLQCGMSQN